MSIIKSRAIQVWGAISTEKQIGPNVFQGNLNADGLVGIYKDLSTV